MRDALAALDMTAVEDRLGSTGRHESGEDGKRNTSPKGDQSNVAIDVSIGANVAIANTNLIAAGVSGSSALVAEGLHSADDVAAAIQRFEDRLQKARPDVKYMCVEPIPRQAQRSQPSPIAR
jgi:hypothetical protein